MQISLLVLTNHNITNTLINFKLRDKEMDKDIQPKFNNKVCIAIRQLIGY